MIGHMLLSPYIWFGTSYIQIPVGHAFLLVVIEFFLKIRLSRTSFRGIEFKSSTTIINRNLTFSLLSSRCPKFKPWWRHVFQPQVHEQVFLKTLVFSNELSPNLDYKLFPRSRSYHFSRRTQRKYVFLCLEIIYFDPCCNKRTSMVLMRSERRFFSI